MYRLFLLSCFLLGCAVRGEPKSTGSQPSTQSEAVLAPISSAAPSIALFDWTSATGAHFQGLEGLPGWGRSTALGVSKDGSTITGFSSEEGSWHRPIRWSRGAMQALPVPALPGMSSFICRAVSDDGRVIVGEGTSTESSNQALSWRDLESPSGVPKLEGFRSMRGMATSADGSVVAGFGTRDDSECQRENSCYASFLWSEGNTRPLQNRGRFVSSQARGLSDSGMVVVGTLIQGSGSQAFRWEDGKIEELGFVQGATTSMGNAVSGDGSVVVGRSFPDAFRYQAGRMEALGSIGIHNRCSAYAVSDDGNRIIGNCVIDRPLCSSVKRNPKLGRKCESVPGARGMVCHELPCFSGLAHEGALVFLWQKGEGMRSLKDILETEHGLDLKGWWLNEAFGISGDGTTIVGNAISPESQQQAWVAVLP